MKFFDSISPEKEHTLLLPFFIMALHIQMSEEAELTLKRKLMRSKISAIAACLGFISVGGAALYFTYTLIQGNEPPAIRGYEPPPSNKPPTNRPKVQELSSKSSPPSASLAPPVIVSTASSNVQMAPSEFPTPDFGIGNQIGIGDGLGGNGIGDGLGDGGGGLGSGDAGGSTLAGTFYDLKLTKSGANSGIEPRSFGKIIGLYSQFLNKWDEKLFSSYYKSPTTLYSSTFILPACDPRYAPYAYQCADKVKPSAWAVVYRGKITAPKSGKFRFVGIGDDIIAVRFNKKLVLEAGWAVPTVHSSKPEVGTDKQYRADVLAGKYPDKKDYQFIQVPGINNWNNQVGGLTAGNIFTVREGRDYPIEIFISEIPGGSFGFVLLIEDVTDGAKGAGNLQLFRTDLSVPTSQELMKMLNEAGCGKGSLQWPQYDNDSLIWVAKPA